MSSTLDEPTLVLNRNWTAVNVVSVRRALILVCREAARIIAPETFETYDFQNWMRLNVPHHQSRIRLVSHEVRLPEVIVLRYSDRPALAHVPFTRRNLFRRDQATCQYCGARPGVEGLSIDHVVPKSRGGITSWTNCVLACLSCNLRKGNRAPESAGMTLKRLPQRPRWVPYEALPKGVRKESWPKFLADNMLHSEARFAEASQVLDAAREGFGP